MWMQILKAAGVPIVGEAFPRDWEERIGVANPEGFFESTLVEGINFLSNPDPVTGIYLSPEESRLWGVKVFLHGVCRTQTRYLDRLLISVRDWRAQRRSLQEMANLIKPQGREEEPTPIEPALTWWVEHYRVMVDAARRGYSYRLVSFEAVLERPSEIIPDVLRWANCNGDFARAVDVVDPRLWRNRGGACPEGLPATWAEAFDDFYSHVFENRPIRPEYLRQMEVLHREIAPLVQRQPAT
jgi:hypothetical protein